MRTTSISLDETCDSVISSMTKQTGLTQSEIYRRLLIAYASGHDASTVLPDSRIYKEAVEAWKEIKK